MNTVTRLKKSKKIVIPLGKIDSMHTLCLFPFNEKSKKGNYGNAQPVRNDNLINVNEETLDVSDSKR